MKKTEIRLVVGCNYHTTWQKKKAMRFVLGKIQGSRALLFTRRTNRKFWTDVKDLIFIKSLHNIKKADRLEARRRDFAELHGRLSTLELLLAATANRLEQDDFKEQIEEVKKEIKNFNWKK